MFWGRLEDKSAVLEMAGPPTLRKKSLEILPFRRTQKKNRDNESFPKVCISSVKRKQPLTEKTQKAQIFKNWYEIRLIGVSNR